MPTPSHPRIEGYAIVSREGMIAKADGTFPPALKIEADQRFFHAALARASAIVNGRHSAERRPESAARPRIVVTRRVPSLAGDPANANAVLWNPAGASFDAAWRYLAVPGEAVAVIGGTDVFGLFLDIGYDAFHLSRTGASVPGGRPVFSLRHGETPEDVLARHGLVIGSETMLDANTNTVVVHWRRGR